MAVDFGVSQIVVVVEDGEQRRQEEWSAMRCMLLIDTNEAARPAWGTAEGDAEAKGYEVFHGDPKELTRLDGNAPPMKK